MTKGGVFGIFLIVACLVGGGSLSVDPPTYELKQHSVVVAKIQGLFSWTVANDNGTEKIVLPQKAVQVTGHQQPRNTFLALTWGQTGVNFTWRLVFEKKNGVVTFSNTSLQIDREQSAQQNISWAVNEQLVENSSLAYECSSLNRQSKSGTVTMEHIRLQPFDLENHDFGQSFVCAKDRTTTSAPTTTSPPKPTPTAGNWTVLQNNFACIRLISELFLNLDYSTNQGTNATKTVQIPADAVVVEGNSTCGFNPVKGYVDGDEQVLQLKFTIGANPWYLFLNFTNNSNLAHTPADRHPSLVYSVRLDYVTDNFTFPNVSTLNERISLENEVNKTTGEGALSLFKSDTSHFYRCNSQEKNTVIRGFEIWTKSLRVEAFLPNRTALMNERVCFTDQQNETSDLVPIITGAALAALVLFVLIAYLVGRARARANTYETI